MYQGFSSDNFDFGGTSISLSIITRISIISGSTISRFHSTYLYAHTMFWGFPHLWLLHLCGNAHYKMSIGIENFTKLLIRITGSFRIHGLKATIRLTYIAADCWSLLLWSILRPSIPAIRECRIWCVVWNQKILPNFAVWITGSLRIHGLEVAALN